MMVLKLLVCAALVLGGAGPAFSQAKDLVMGNANPPKHNIGLAAQRFNDKLWELTRGKVSVTHRHSGALGGERETAQKIQQGAVDLGPITTTALSTLVPEMSLFQLPYLFRNSKQLYAALGDSDVVRSYYEPIFEKHGFKLLAFYPAGYRNIYGHFPINSVEDVKGRKIGVQEDKTLIATFKALGMIPTPIALTEVATGLRTKVIDSAEGTFDTFYDNKFYDIVKNVANVPHTQQCVVLIMSKASWGKQDPVTQRAILEAARYSEQWIRKLFIDQDRQIRRLVEDTGVTITEPDAAPFRQATASVYEEFYATPAGRDARKVVDYILSLE